MTASLAKAAPRRPGPSGGKQPAPQGSPLSLPLLGSPLSLLLLGVLPPTPTCGLAPAGLPGSLEEVAPRRATDQAPTRLGLCRDPVQVS